MEGGLFLRADFRSGLGLNPFYGLQHIARAVQRRVETPQITGVDVAHSSRSSPFPADQHAQPTGARQDGGELRGCAVVQEFADSFVPVRQLVHAATQIATISCPDALVPARGGRRGVEPSD